MLEAATPETYNFRFSAGRGFRQKLERLAEVLGVRDPVRHMGEILEKAVDCLLERKDPERCRARRLVREERRVARTEGGRVDRGDDQLDRAQDVERRASSVLSSAGPAGHSAAHSPLPLPSVALEPAPAPAWEAAQARAAETVEAAEELAGTGREAEPRDRGASGRRGAGEKARLAGPAPPTGPEPRGGSLSPGSRRPRDADWDEALYRAGYQCEFRGRDGRRCTARTGLQADHYPVPWAVSRSSDPKSLSQKSILAAAGCAGTILRRSDSTIFSSHIASSSLLASRRLARPRLRSDSWDRL